MNTRSLVALAAFAGLALTAGPALAHPGHIGGFADGLLHPLTGADHLLAMVSVGLWAGLRGGKAAWAWPAAFVGFMVVGGALGAALPELPLIEPLIALSVVVLGAALVFGTRTPVVVGAVICAAFAIVHGWAHGAEMPENAVGLAYGAGFVIATATLHAAGLIAVRAAALALRKPVARVLGAAIVGSGVALLFQ